MITHTWTVKDKTCRAMTILHDEDTHVDWLEARADQIKQMGVEHYLATQTGA